MKVVSSTLFFLLLAGTAEAGKKDIPVEPVPAPLPVPVAIPVLAPVAPKPIPVGGAHSCTLQKDCTAITINKIDNGVCSGDCGYQICFAITLGASCVRTRGPISGHTCLQDDTKCLTSVSLKGGKEYESPVDGFTQCQTVPAGGTAIFVLKDGSKCEGPGIQFDAIGGGAIECNPTTMAKQTCTGKDAGVECIWTVKAPELCGSGGGIGGDPHFRLWNRTRYGFHGECDLVLLSHPNFNNGEGLDFHVRTTMQDFFSFMESAALRIGDSILEFHRGAALKFWIDGVEKSNDDLPLSFAGLTLNAPFRHGSTDIYRLDLHSGGFIQFRVHEMLLSADVFGVSEDFEGSVGLLGDYSTSKMLARNGMSVIDNEDEFGLQWQVRQGEPMLFREARAPQWPQMCNMPTITERHLALYDDKEKVARAELVCSHKDAEDFDFCVFDVLATGDESLAGAW